MTKATIRDLLDHWAQVASKGTVPANTAKSYATSVTRILSDLPNWESIEIDTLDLDAEFERFADHHGHEFANPTSLTTYRTRLHRAFAGYQQYRQDPDSWHPRKRRRDSSVMGMAMTSSTSGARHELPLADGRIASLVLPLDLTRADVDRIIRLLHTLPLDEDIAVQA